MKPKNKSIRKQLLLWVLIPILCTIGLSIFSSYFFALSFANNAFDLELEENARALAGQVTFKKGHWTLASPELSLSVFQNHNQDRDHVYYLITDEEGHYIGGDSRLGATPRRYGFSSFANKIIDGQPVRVVTLHVPLESPEGNSFMFVQMAETLEERAILANEVLFDTIAHQLALGILTMICVWFGVSRGLIPLERLRKEISQRTVTELAPLNEANTPDEVQPLVHAMNGLMQRLDKHIGLQQRFIANAAHQLRTPLAGLQTQLEVAIREEDPAAHSHALNQMQISLDRAIHLAQQLLALSKAEPETLTTASFTSLNFPVLVAETLELFAPLALKKEMDLSFEAPEASLFINGHAFSLAEMVSNIIENALIYTPTHGQVQIKVTEAENAVQLLVEDNGPGIPKGERNKVFERFYRIRDTRNIAGSGLGLAIVQEIAKAHEAEVTLHTGKNGVGTRVQVSFTKCTASAFTTEKTSLSAGLIS